MAQQNTSNTDADTAIVDYPAPSPLNRIGIKVGLGLGLLLSLFVIGALVSLFQARIVDEKVRQITEVEEPTSAAAYEMEINVIGVAGMSQLQEGLSHPLGPAGIGRQHARKGLGEDATQTPDIVTKEFAGVNYQLDRPGAPGQIRGSAPVSTVDSGDLDAALGTGHE